MTAQRSAETEQRIKEFTDYLHSGAVDAVRLAELRAAAVASAQRDYEASQSAAKAGEAPSVTPQP